MLEAGGYARSIGFPKGQGSNQVKWFEKLPGARNPEGILHSASLARPKLKQRGVPRGPELVEGSPRLRLDTLSWKTIHS